MDVGLQLRRRGLITFESAPRLEREVSGTRVERFRMAATAAERTNEDARRRDAAANCTTWKDEAEAEAVDARRARAGESEYLTNGRCTYEHGRSERRAGLTRLARADVGRTLRVLRAGASGEARD